MKYIRNFAEHTNYEAEMSKIPTPSVSYCRKENECHFMPSNVIMFKVGDLNGNTNQTVTVNYYEGGSETIPIVEGDRWYVVNVPSGKSLQQFVGIKNITDTIISAKIKFVPYAFIQNISGNLTFLTCDTSELTSMNDMFAHCESIQVLDVDLDTSNVTSMNGVFDSCVLLKNLDLSNWNVENVTDIGGMFNQCFALQNLNTSGWSTSKITSMYHTFSGCHSLQNLDLSNWNVRNVTNMESMFYNCYSLKTLDLSGWDTSNAAVRGMFDSCSSLKTIYMRNCSQTTIDKIKAQLKTDGILNNVTIITE